MNEQRSWRRSPLGAGLSVLLQRQQRIQQVPMQAVHSMDPDEYGEMLRAEGASEKMIKRDVKQLREIQKAAAERRAMLEDSVTRERQVSVPAELDEYAEAEIRRTAGVAAEDVIEGLRDEASRDYLKELRRGS